MASCTLFVCLDGLDTEIVSSVEQPIIAVLSQLQNHPSIGEICFLPSGSHSCTETIRNKSA